MCGAPKLRLTSSVAYLEGSGEPLEVSDQERGGLRSSPWGSQEQGWKCCCGQVFAERLLYTRPQADEVPALQREQM